MFERITAGRLAAYLMLAPAAIANARLKAGTHKLGVHHRSKLLELVAADRITMEEVDHICPLRLTSGAIETLRIMHAEGTLDAEIARMRAEWGAP